MTRKALLWILGAAWLQLCHAAPVGGVPDAQAEAFMRKSGLWEQLAEIEPGVQKGIAQSDAELRQLNDEQLERLREAGRAAYGADRLRSAMRIELAASLPAAETEQALQPNDLVIHAKDGLLRLPFRPTHIGSAQSARRFRAFTPQGQTNHQRNQRRGL